ncbi:MULTISPECIES: ABC-F family ATP-binding cassette domain-containing protein [Lacticaseibacillus]|uniref:ABC-F family ATP-binding cassette domain-containing protein n=2 Tax=Lacticaseibacillus TaxID=2759736 RepID=A0AAN1C7Z3_LACCA|nr:MULTISPECIES: ABC-F family ATP-binding cassette domain-containing protein [Lacticaseibacillus]ARY91474.1 multidrug ABC transporter ATP-binding protein [Lacticaseibacillus casei]KAB1968582.1 ABC-F family ATP-binding cassette domain-containing protein [Lacticaseibacillus casei]WLV82091.1 ABC-F family ATP-binding cassette domain-containing protein [Lacticaseibacillus sp. NCIMB 15473]WNX25997.1 ABC-F family ATP-binding cassette domain-containing protein [Lacticaseibacillus casei]WNX28770.1 ABC-
MQTLTAEGLSKAYGDKQLFKQIDFLINEGERIGLIGVNGTGKTTLIRALAGLEALDAGTVKTPKNYRISYLAQVPDLDPELPIMDAIYRGDSPVFQAIRQYERALAAYTKDPLNQAKTDAYTKADARMTQEDAWSAETDIKTILTQLHIDDLSARVGSLSGGQQKRVGLAQVLIESPDLLLLDEPTNHLDFDSIAWLEKYLSNYRGALIVVTHDRYFLDRVTNRIFELDRGRLFQYQGNYQAYVAKKADQLEAEKSANHKQAQLYRQELAWMHAGAQARSTKQQARINRFKELQAAKDDAPTPDQQLDPIQIASARLGKKVIEMNHANLSFGHQVILNDFNWLVQPGTRIGITGQNGAGKSTLLNIIAGKQKLDSGTISLGETVQLGYYTQMNTDLDPNKRIITYLQEVGEEVVQADGQRVSVTQMLEQFLFPRNMHGTLIGRLSGGEKRRLYLLQVLMRQPNVLLLDEPTNDLDIATLTVLEDYLDHFPGTVITVSHDRYFLDKVADQLLIFNGNGQIDRAVGEFSDYLAKQAAQPATPKAKPVATKPAPEKVAPKAKSKLTYAEKIEYDKLQQELDELDERLAKVQAEMADVNGEDYVKLGDLQAKSDKINQTIDQKFDRFAELDQYV